MIWWIQDKMTFRLASTRFLNAYSAARPSGREVMLAVEQELTDMPDR